MVVFLLLPEWMHLDIRILGAWVAGVLCFLSLVAFLACTATHESTRYRTQAQEAQHSAVFLLVVITACTSIFAIALMQTNNKDLPGLALGIEVGLSIVAILCSWFLTHTMFALHYATCYYRKQTLFSPEHEYEGGLSFPGEDCPDYWDFIYFAFTIGMTAQTSDVSIPKPFMRRLAIAHGIVAFFFYMVILASSVNTASSLI
jgi:uncharacterized membrane protein